MQLGPDANTLIIRLSTVCLLECSSSGSGSSSSSSSSGKLTETHISMRCTCSISCVNIGVVYGITPRPSSQPTPPSSSSSSTTTADKLTAVLKGTGACWRKLSYFHYAYVAFHCFLNRFFEYNEAAARSGKAMKVVTLTLDCVVLISVKFGIISLDLKLLSLLIDLKKVNSKSGKSLFMMMKQFHLQLIRVHFPGSCQTFNVISVRLANWSISRGFTSRLF